MGKVIDWVAVEGVYRAGGVSLRAIAAEYGTSEATVRRRAKKNGWVQDATGTKRRIVADRLSGVSHDATQCAMRQIASAADQDINDMESGLAVARMCLRNLLSIAEQSLDAREIKVIVEANKAAVETIRRIRGLDDTPDGTVTVSWAGL